MNDLDTVYCPFCDKKTVQVVRRQGYKGSSTSRGSGQNSRSNYYVPDSFEVLTGCSECGKTLKEVKKELEG